MFGPDGVLHWVHVVLSSYVADIDEQAKLALLKIFPANFSDPTWIVHKKDLDNHRLDLQAEQKRDEEKERDARAIYRQSGQEADLEYSELPLPIDFEVRERPA